MFGLYLHIPFCSAICNYCNFNRGLFDAALKARYVEALIAEIATGGRCRTAQAHGSPADTIYFGGGTPSLLEPAEIARHHRAPAGGVRRRRRREVTLEANPETRHRSSGCAATARPASTG